MEKLTIDAIKELDMKPLILPNKPIVVYGAGALGRIAVRKFREMNIQVLGICDSDSNKLGVEIEGLIVQSLQQLILEIESGFQVAIAVGEQYYDEVKNQLSQSFDPSDFYQLNVYDPPLFEESRAVKELYLGHFDACKKIYDALEDPLSKHTFLNVIKGRITFETMYFNEVVQGNQYFNELTQDIQLESFVDAGAFNGDTLKAFISFCHNEYESIVSLEPFEECFKLLEQTLQKDFSKDTRIRIEKKALSNQERRIAMNESMGASSSIVGLSEVCDHIDCEMIETIRLDSLQLPRVTFIKMDIEGSELEALEGAKETILRYMPKLAICVYHKPEDLFVIPKWIMNLNLNYQYYMRHHGNQSFNQHCETVFYAIPRE